MMGLAQACVERRIEADEHHAVPDPGPSDAWNDVVITMPEHDHIRGSNVNALDQCFIAIEDHLQIVVEFRLDVIGRI